MKFDRFNHHQSAVIGIAATLTVLHQIAGARHQAAVKALEAAPKENEPLIRALSDRAATTEHELAQLAEDLRITKEIFVHVLPIGNRKIRREMDRAVIKLYDEFRKKAGEMKELVRAQEKAQEQQDHEHHTHQNPEDNSNVIPITEEPRG